MRNALVNGLDCKSCLQFSVSHLLYKSGLMKNFNALCILKDAA